MTPDPPEGAELMIFLAEAIRTARTDRRMTQQDLGELAGIHPMAVSKLERGIQRDVGIMTLQRIARALSTHAPITTAELVTAAETGLRPRIVLSPAAFDRVVELIENPPPPTPALVALMSTRASASTEVGPDDAARIAANDAAEVVAIEAHRRDLEEDYAKYREARDFVHEDA